ncbi:ATP synthase subunit I [Veillonella montpellierensis]|uniref:ATP synthase subunit I n=1 Tax=Veillonella montpellierensis TaxID=187328 RepID=UPI0023F8476A|nr:ATP synthase subunit I [Veillonella montpellierensis]
MREYTQFIKRVLLATIVVTLAGMTLFFMTHHMTYMAGWLWGCMIHIVYLVLLGFHMKRVQGRHTRDVVRHVRGHMGVRLVSVMALVVVGFQWPILDPIGIVLGLVVNQILSYGIYWKLS